MSKVVNLVQFSGCAMNFEDFQKKVYNFVELYMCSVDRHTWGRPEKDGNRYCLMCHKKMENGDK